MPVASNLSTAVIHISDAGTDRDMDLALVQRAVRRRINDRRLPLGRAVGIREMLGDDRPCDACDEPISPSEKLVLAMVSLCMTVRFHIDCYKGWDGERRAPFGEIGREGSIN
jgi:hypothetical protein